MVGFNRRFAPAIRVLRTERPPGPLQLSFRIFAGRLRSDHWYHDPRQGGRIAGEVCHFVDAANHLIGTRPVSVTAHTDDSEAGLLAQNMTALIQYEDGSTAALTYAGYSPPGPRKELLEVAGQDFAGTLDDYSRLTIWKKKRRTYRFGRESKGHREEVACLIKLMNDDAPGEADFQLSLSSTLVTCRILRAIVKRETQETQAETPALKEALGS